ncbi:circularly permutated Ras protein 1 [Echeneis naucrates]|uniref:circularly permutated Ras protein 1 n=1 Tax=Echeneis naucrates TaxID=173247 RepID=UPI0011144025|nr:circularly permutated Ras protein 1-like [Echeneis naucrates]
MEFACSHVVCNWISDGSGAFLIQNEFDNRVAVKEGDQSDHVYDNRAAVKEGSAPPPLPPRHLKKHQLTSPPLPPPPTSRRSLPPPVPPRTDRLEAEVRLNANVNVVSLNVGKLVNIQQATGTGTLQSPVVCGKCSAALSCLSSVQKNVWLCEFCGCENGVGEGLEKLCVGQRVGVHSDDLYLPNESDTDYQNLEDTLVVFCVDISGSMCVTTEVTSSDGFPAHVSRLEGIQDALQRTLSSTLQQSPHRRVALVTFSDEVVIYGDGTRTPLTLRDWALVDYNHIWQQGAIYSIPHCIAETYLQLTQRVKDLREHGATCLGPAALASVAMASRYPGSKVILCTDGRANIGLGAMEETPQLSSSSPISHFYTQLALQAVESGVIISVMSFEGTDCRLADVGRLADSTGGRVNIVNIGTIATEIQSASMDNVLATGVTATLLGSDGMYFPYENKNDHKMVREIGNVTKGLEITFEFAVKPEFMEAFQQRDKLPFQVQLHFKTRDQQRVTRVLTELRPVASSSRIRASRVNVAILSVHCAQLCACLTMEGRVREAQMQLKAQQDLLEQISKHRPIEKQDSIYGNWMDTMTTICDLTTESQTLSDEAAEVVYQMKRASSCSNNNNSSSSSSNATKTKKKPARKPKVLLEGM